MLWIAAPPPRASTPSRPRKVVVIEHVNLYRQTLVDVLQMSPLQASVVAHAASDVAVAAVIDAPPDLVVCEFDSKPLRGPDVVRAVTAANRGLKVVLLLDEPDPDILALALQSGASGVFTKQTEPDVVIAGISAVLQECRSLSGDLIEMLVEEFARPALTARAGAGDRRMTPGRAHSFLAPQRGLGAASSVLHFAEPRVPDGRPRDLPPN